MADGKFAIVCLYGEVAQLVEARILESRMRFAQQFSLGLENPLVVGSIPTLTIVIKYANSKSPGYAQSVEHRTINAEVAGSSPAPGNTSVLFF